MKEESGDPLRRPIHLHTTRLTYRHTPHAHTAGDGGRRKGRSSSAIVVGYAYAELDEHDDGRG